MSERCELWPECSCNRILCHYQEMLDRDVVLELSEILSAEFNIFHALECAAVHCPDLTVKRYCAAQLVNRYLNEHRQGDFAAMVERYAEKRA